MLSVTNIKFAYYYIEIQASEVGVTDDFRGFFYAPVGKLVKSPDLGSGVMKVRILPGVLAPLTQQAEVSDLKSVQSWFESKREYIEINRASYLSRQTPCSAKRLDQRDNRTLQRRALCCEERLQIDNYSNGYFRQDLTLVGSCFFIVIPFFMRRYSRLGKGIFCGTMGILVTPRLFLGR